MADDLLATSSPGSEAPAETMEIRASARAGEPGGSADEARSRLTRRRRTLIAVTVGATLVAGGGLAASAFVKSPAELAAETKAPEASVLSAPVEKRVLTDVLTTRGLVAASTQTQVTPAASAAQGAASSVISALHTSVGKQVKAGDVLLDVSGRPVIALPGTSPAFRDLKPNDDGDDVGELQTALAGLGFSSGSDKKGHFGSGTKRAVTDFYKHLGYDVPTTGGPNDATDQAQIVAAQNAVDAAQRNLDDFDRKVSASSANSSISSAASASSSSSLAAHSSSSSSSSPANVAPTGGGTAGPTTAPAAPGPTPTGTLSTVSGEEPVALQRSYLVKTLDQAETTQATLIATTGPMVPLAETVFLPGFPAQVTQLPAKVGDKVTGPVITLSSGTLGITARVTPDQARLLKAGMKADIVAEAIGQNSSGSVAAIGSVTVDTPQGQGGQGQGAQQADGAPAAPNAGSGGDGTPYVPVTINPGTSLDAKTWAGQDVRVTITSAATSGPVLVVPQSAVSAGADGRTVVSKIGPDGRTTVRTEVRAGISGGGFVEVAPVTPGALAEGDRVVIGQ
jgi:multidrug efflux pump subunit AcrA (membrane-fusion protein)